MTANPPVWERPTRSTSAGEMDPEIERSRELMKKLSAPVGNDYKKHIQFASIKDLTPQEDLKLSSEWNPDGGETKTIELFAAKLSFEWNPDGGETKTIELFAASEQARDEMMDKIKEKHEQSRKKIEEYQRNSKQVMTTDFDVELKEKITCKLRLSKKEIHGHYLLRLTGLVGEQHPHLLLAETVEMRSAWISRIKQEGSRDWMNALQHETDILSSPIVNLKKKDSNTLEFNWNGKSVRLTAKDPQEQREWKKKIQEAIDLKGLPTTSIRIYDRGTTHADYVLGMKFGKGEELHQYALKGHSTVSNNWMENFDKNFAGMYDEHFKGKVTTGARPFIYSHVKGRQRTVEIRVRQEGEVYDYVVVALLATNGEKAHAWYERIVAKMTEKTTSVLSYYEMTEKTNPLPKALRSSYPFA